MKNVLALSAVVLFSGCTTAKVADSMFRSYAENNYCTLNPVTRMEARRIANFGEDVKVFIQCPGEDICQAPAPYGFQTK